MASLPPMLLSSAATPVAAAAAGAAAALSIRESIIVRFEADEEDEDEDDSSEGGVLFECRIIEGHPVIVRTDRVTGTITVPRAVSRDDIDEWVGVLPDGWEDGAPAPGQMMDPIIDRLLARKSLLPEYHMDNGSLAGISGERSETMPYPHPYFGSRPTPDQCLDELHAMVSASPEEALLRMVNWRARYEA